jgi:predicted PurR-regulated permease PerM
MIGLDRRAARAAWTVLLILLAVVVVYVIRKTLILFVLALLLAHLLSPIVDFIARHTPRRISRNLALAIVYVLLLAFLSAAAVGIGSQVVNQATALASKVPDWLKEGSETAMPIPAWLDPVREHILNWLRDETASLSSQAVPFLRKAGMDIISGIGNLVMFILIPILSFFFLKDGHAMRESIVGLFESYGRGAVVEDIFSDVHIVLAQYIRALVLLAGATFCFYTLFLQITGASYALLLAGVAALLEVIPVVGPLTATAIIVVVTVFSGYQHLIWLLIFLALYRLFQDYVLSPYLMGSGVEIHPLLVLFGVLAGEQLGGIPGMFFSVPVIAALRVVYVRLARERDRRRVSSESV